MRKSTLMQRISIMLTDEMRATLALLEERFRHAPKATIGRLALVKGMQQMLADEAVEKSAKEVA